jgi:cyclase
MKGLPRVIPILLLKNNGLYKTEKFKIPKYIGDPINAIKIFNDKEVDELIFLDITASKENKEPNLEMLKDIASECFMPLSYGGGVRSTDAIREILNVGVEKISINTEAVRNPKLIGDAAVIFGSSTIIVSIDVKKNMFGKYHVYINDGEEKTNMDPIYWAKEVERLGAGEILINSIDKDGTLQGYDYSLIKSVSSSVNIPVVAAGGAGSIADFVKAVKDSHASAVAAGAFFVYQGKHKAVLITYPEYQVLTREFDNLII